MRTADLHYALPSELIAQQPIEPRDAARLLVLDRETGALAHRRFREISAYLRPGDCLVLNDTRVIPARFFCRRRSGGRVEVLFLHTEPEGWQVLLRSNARLRAGETLVAEADAEQAFQLVERGPRGAACLRPAPLVDPVTWLDAHGATPLPPYIERPGGPEATDVGRYQTVYAASPGAVAAPTAGLHFTPELLDRLRAGGVECATVTLHVGLGTFQPIAAEELAGHTMHSEWYQLSAATLAQLAATRRRGGRLVAIGTTTVRVLESLPEVIGAVTTTTSAAGADAADRRGGWTDIFIYPPYQFRNVDALVTNFHLPGSTLLALVMALATPQQVRAAYEAAVAERYRFYSYGDAMLLI